MFEVQKYKNFKWWDELRGRGSLSTHVHVILSSPKEVRATRLRPSFCQYSPQPPKWERYLYTWVVSIGKASRSLQVPAHPLGAYPFSAMSRFIGHNFVNKQRHFPMFVVDLLLVTNSKSFLPETQPNIIFMCEKNSTLKAYSTLQSLYCVFFSFFFSFNYFVYLIHPSVSKHSTKILCILDRASLW